MPGTAHELKGDWQTIGVVAHGKGDGRKACQVCYLGEAHDPVGHVQVGFTGAQRISRQDRGRAAGRGGRHQVHLTQHLLKLATEIRTMPLGVNIIGGFELAGEGQIQSCIAPVITAVFTVFA